MGRGHGGTRGSGGGASASQRAYMKEFNARISQPRTTIQKGTPEYKEAQAIANTLVNSANESGYGMLGGSSWEMAADRINYAVEHVTKHGNDFEKSVAASVGKTVRDHGRGRQVAYISNKQAWVLGKSMAETHVKRDDMPW